MPDAFRSADPQEVWTQAGGLRNVIIHPYFGIDSEVVRGVLERDLPDMKNQVLKILSLP